MPTPTLALTPTHHFRGADEGLARAAREHAHRTDPHAAAAHRSVLPTPPMQGCAHQSVQDWVWARSRLLSARQLSRVHLTTPQARGRGDSRFCDCRGQCEARCPNPMPSQCVHPAVGGGEARQRNDEPCAGQRARRSGVRTSERCRAVTFGREILGHWSGAAPGDGQEACAEPTATCTSWHQVHEPQRHMLTPAGHGCLRGRLPPHSHINWSLG